MLGEGDLFIPVCAAAVVVLGGLVWWLFYHNRFNPFRSRHILDDVLETMGYGLVFFNAKGQYYAANGAAFSFLPVREILENSAGISGFLNYMYDHAVHCDTNLKGVIQRAAGHFSDRKMSFCDAVLSPSGKVCLVIAQKTCGGHTVLVIMDIQSQLQREKNFTMMSEENYQLFHAIESSNIGVAISAAGQNGNPLIFANSAMSKISGLERHALMGGFWVELLAAFEDYADLKTLEQAFLRAKPLELNLTRKADGRRYWYSLTITPVLDDEGNAEYFIGIFKDTTDLKIREAEFFRAQKLDALGQLSAGIAHDFNNILSIIDGYAALAEKRLHDAPEICADYMARIHVASQRGAALTRRMMTFGSYRVADESVHALGQIVRDQQVLVNAVLEPTDVTLFMDIRAEDIYVTCAPDSISQILMNLIINARDAIGAADGVISVKVAAFTATETQHTFSGEGHNFPQHGHMLGKLKNVDYAVISVMDSGCGMDDETINRIFDPFYTTKIEGKGTGLGLSVVYGLVKDMDGAISVTSEPGRGTEICVYIPRCEAPVILDVNEGERFLERGSLVGMNAMVVDNESDILEVTSGFLREWGMHVICASGGDEALLLQDDFDGDIHVLVSDILMPDMNGIKLAELFSSLRPETKIVFISGYAAAPDGKSLAIPPDAICLAKPLRAEKLKDVLEQLLLPSNFAPDSDAASGVQETGARNNNESRRIA